MILTILWALVSGFVIGLVARALVPGDHKMGFFPTACVGIGGSFVGGFLARLIFHVHNDFSPAGFIGSVIGGMILIVAGGFINKSMK